MLTGVCFSGEYAKKGAQFVIDKVQGDGEGADGGSEAGGAEDKGKGGFDLSNLVKGDDDKKEGGQWLAAVPVTTSDSAVCASRSATLTLTLTPPTQCSLSGVDLGALGGFASSLMK